MIHNPRQEWPMPSYMQAWKAFRQMSDENHETALHLLSRPSWPTVDKTVITDVGCGDGMLVQQVVLHSKSEISEVRLYDPDREFLAEAERRLTETPCELQIKASTAFAEDIRSADLRGSHAILAVHVVYLMQEDGLAALLRELPIGTPLYIVLDQPHSVFSRLWRGTAPKYFERSRKTHQLVARLPRDTYGIEQSVITSHLQNPLVQRRDIRDAVLSILCYADVQDMEKDDYDSVQKEIARCTVGSHVLCESTCYEIVRTC